MKARRFFLLTTFVAVSAACSLNMPQVANIETGATQTFTLNEPHHVTDKVIDISLSMAVGKFNLQGGAESLIEGEIRYNVDAWKPVITSQGNSITVSQGDKDYTIRGFPDADVVNIWSIKLGKMPMNLSLQAGAYDAILDLSGLPIHTLNVQDGAGDSEVSFDTLNPEEMQSLFYKTSASNIVFRGLANANFKEMIFEGGAGDYVFDFSGALQRDATVRIKVGLSNVHILVPADISATVFIDRQPASISRNGAWIEEGDHFVNGSNRSQLTIMLEMAAGSLQLGSLNNK